jgi:hypothetical protein
MKIQIKDIEITLKSTFRTYIIFENITGKSFQNVATLSDILCFMYATIWRQLKMLKYRLTNLWIISTRIQM